MIDIIGGGLAGVEAARILSRNGFCCRIIEMRPGKMTEAHKSGALAELVCSNSLKSDDPLCNSKGLLKKEMRLLGSLVLEAADECAVPAGLSLNVDRERFSTLITERIAGDPNIEIVREEALSIRTGRTSIIATGPLTSGAMAEYLRSVLRRDAVYFFDAVSIVLEAGSIDKSRCFSGSRYGKGSGNILNMPLDRDEYGLFYNTLVNARTYPLKEFEKNFFEACLPIEVVAKRGFDALTFGTLRPVGFAEYSSVRPFAVVQARPESLLFDAYELIGFQTNLLQSEQARLLSTVPALKNAKFIRYGMMHRNIYIDSPELLNNDLSLKGNEKIYFAGQITGVEGYIESALCGILCGLSLVQKLMGFKDILMPSSRTLSGALLNYITSPQKGFQPMGANYSLLNGGRFARKIRKTRLHDEAIAEMISYIVKLRERGLNI